MGIVILIIILIIAIALACPVKILAFTTPEKKLKLLYKWLFFTFGKKPNPNSPIIKFAKRVTGISRFESIENIGDNVKNLGMESTVKDILGVLKSILYEVKYLLPKCTIQKFRLKINCADEDAATTAIMYGGICASVYPAVGIFYSFTKQKKGCTDIEIKCDFDSEASEFSVDCTVSFTTFYGLIAFLRLWIKDYKSQKGENQER